MPGLLMRILETKAVGTGRRNPGEFFPSRMVGIGTSLRGCPEMGARAAARTGAKPFRLTKVPV